MMRIGYGRRIVGNVQCMCRAVVWCGVYPGSSRRLASRHADEQPASEGAGNSRRSQNADRITPPSTLSAAPFVADAASEHT